IEFASDFDPTAFHLLRIEVSSGQCSVMVDNRSCTSSVETEGPAGELTFFSENAKFGLSAIELTGGFETNFDASDDTPSEILIEAGRAWISNKCLYLTATDAAPAMALFRLPYRNFELAANLAIRDRSKTTEYGLLLFGRERKPLGRLLAMPGKHVLEF